MLEHPPYAGRSTDFVVVASAHTDEHAQQQRIGKALPAHYVTSIEQVLVLLRVGQHEPCGIKRIGLLEVFYQLQVDVALAVEPRLHVAFHRLERFAEGDVAVGIGKHLHIECTQRECDGLEIRKVGLVAAKRCHMVGAGSPSGKRVPGRCHCSGGNHISVIGVGGVGRYGILHQFVGQQIALPYQTGRTPVDDIRHQTGGRYVTDLHLVGVYVQFLKPSGAGRSEQRKNYCERFQFHIRMRV